MIPLSSSHGDVRSSSQCQAKFGSPWHWFMVTTRPGFYIQKAIENGPVEIVDWPSYEMVIFHSYVKLPEGIWDGIWLEWHVGWFGMDCGLFGMGWNRWNHQPDEFWMVIMAGPCQDRPASFSDESRRGRGPQPPTFQDLDRFGVYPKIMVVNLP